MTIEQIKEMVSGSEYDFLRINEHLKDKIESDTSASIHKNKSLLQNISSERIQSELLKMLIGKDILDVLIDYSDILSEIIPEFKECIGFNQNNPYHKYTVYEHIAHAVSNYNGDDVDVKMALLLHDIGKPRCYTEDEKGGHFHGHPKVSYEITKRIVEELRFDKKSQDAITELVLYHDTLIEPSYKTIRRWLNKLGEERLTQLIDVRMADILAHSEVNRQQRIDSCNQLRRNMEEIIAEMQCFSLKHLNVSGHDILAIGVKEGKNVGVILNHLLNKVIDEEIANDHDELITEAKQYISKEALA